MRRGWEAAALAAATIAGGIAGARPAQAQAQEADFEPRWRLRVGHSYSSVTALRQPATFVVSADLGRPALTLIDAGFLVQGPLAMRGGLDVGARYAGGSGRSTSRRIFSAITRGWRRFDRIVVAGDAEYEAASEFESQKGLAGVEATLAYGPRGLGQPWSPSVRFRWRPWVGLGWGTVFRTAPGVADPESGGFARGHARLELHYAAGAIEAVRGDSRAPVAELDVELTGWMLFDDARGEGFVKAALALPLAAGFSAAASAGLGRQPPQFELERRVGIGLGFRY